MKKIFLLALLIGFGTIGTLQAQFTGKKFIEGNAFINFKQNNNDSPDLSTNEYGYNFNISLAKFRTETRASGLRISNSLGGGKSFYSSNSNGTGPLIEKSGLRSIGFGVGHFWQFYKHFNENVGIFGGPSVDLGYSNSKNYNPDGGYLQENKSNKINLGLNLSAGIYYNLSEKWWVTASIAFANPVGITYENINYSNIAGMNESTKVNQLEYQLTPTFTFPSVGLGVRYFYGR